jgi:hypothetical protein
MMLLLTLRSSAVVACSGGGALFHQQGSMSELVPHALQIEDRRRAKNRVRALHQLGQAAKGAARRKLGQAAGL